MNSMHGNRLFWLLQCGQHFVRLPRLCSAVRETSFEDARQCMATRVRISARGQCRMQRSPQLLARRWSSKVCASQIRNYNVNTASFRSCALHLIVQCGTCRWLDNDCALELQAIDTSENRFRCTTASSLTHRREMLLEWVQRAEHVRQVRQTCVDE